MFDPSNFITNDPQVMFTLIKASNDLNILLGQDKLAEAAEYFQSIDPLAQSAFFLILRKNWHDASNELSEAVMLLRLFGYDLHDAIEKSTTEPIRVAVERIENELRKAVNDRMEHRNEEWVPKTHKKPAEPPVSQERWEGLVNMLKAAGIEDVLQEEEGGQEAP